MRAPLEKMKIRIADLEDEHSADGVTSKLKPKASPVGGSFGYVRSSGRKPHQGWDLYAEIGTPVYAISPGIVEFTASKGDYGTQICVRLQEKALSGVRGIRPAKPKYAFYAHLLISFVKAGQAVLEGDVIALSGKSGNAGNVPPHLHFEIRTKARAGKGLGGRIDPGEVLGYGYYTCE